MTFSDTTHALFRQFVYYGICGGIAAGVLLIVLAGLVELTGMPETLASAIGFACATPVNYGLQHRFVFKQNGRHGVFFARYVAVTLLTLGLNTALFWVLTEGVGVFYLLSQVLTVGTIMLVNFGLNRSFTFATPAATLAANGAVRERA